MRTRYRVPLGALLAAILLLVFVVPGNGQSPGASHPRPTTEQPASGDARTAPRALPGHVFFNDPLPCADAAIRAIRMAVAMRSRVQDLATEWTRRGHDLGFSIGIAQGFATMGRIGYEGRYDYAAIGSVTNLASRLCSEATQDQILVTQRVHGADRPGIVATITGVVARHAHAVSGRPQHERPLPEVDPGRPRAPAEPRRHGGEHRL